MKSLIRKLIPKFIISWYHLFLALFSKWFFGNPSGKMIVIGVTGTNGKSTVINLLGRILEGAGHKVGWTTTVNFKVGDKEWLNKKKMTMIGKLGLQKLLRQMVDKGCEYAIIETSSEGIKQFRHLGINYDMTVFTNLTPEHIESHGSFDKYKAAKGRLFKHLANSKRKIINNEKQDKISVINLDSEHSSYFLKFNTDQKFGFTSNSEPSYIKNIKHIIVAKNAKSTDKGSIFDIKAVHFDIKLLGTFNIENSLAAISTAQALGVDLETCQKALSSIKNIPGRMEFIKEGQDFKILIDYAPEVESMKKLYEFIKSNLNPKGKIIHLLGSCGGGRDKSRRKILGELAAKNADVIIITNEDPYDEDPMQIIEAVAEGAEIIVEKNRLTKQLYKILDRKGAIHKALSLAEAGDLVLLTGKGSEQAICIARGKKIEWDEREVVREELKILDKR